MQCGRSGARASDQDQGDDPVLWCVVSCRSLAARSRRAPRNMGWNQPTSQWGGWGRRFPARASRTSIASMLLRRSAARATKRGVRICRVYGPSSWRPRSRAPHAPESARRRHPIFNSASIGRRAREAQGGWLARVGPRGAPSSAGTLYRRASARVADLRRREEIRTNCKGMSIQKNLAFEQQTKQ